MATTTPARHRGRRLTQALGALTTPLVPDDFLALLNPLWTGELHARVEAVLPETAEAATLVLRPGRRWSGHVPGQYVRVGVDVDGVRHWRAYSLTCLPGGPPTHPGRLSVTVRAMPDGTVSGHLVHRVRPGTVLRLAAAEGSFVLPARRPGRALFVTAGSGITPVMGMLRQLEAEGRLDGGAAGTDAVLMHSAPRATDVVFGEELRGMAARHAGFRLQERHTDRDGLLAPGDLAALVPDWGERETWACGPARMLDGLLEHLEQAGRAEQLHTERFRPRVAAAPGGGGAATFTRSGVTAEADAATPLLDAGERAGALLPSGCRMGICFGCVGVLTAGAVRDLRTGAVTTAPETGEGAVVQTCVSAAAGPCSLDL